jgi:hypothetical protein
VNRKLGDNRLARTGGRCHENALPLLYKLACLDLEGIQIKIAGHAKVLDDRMGCGNT